MITQKKSRKPAVQERRIHILAKCPYFEVSELISEDKAVGRLESIQNNFLRQDDRYGLKDAVLKVKTCVHNPTLF